MVLGFLRRRKGKPDRSARGVDQASTPVSSGGLTRPRGKFVGDGYIPLPEELEAAIPLPRSVDDWIPPAHGVSEELYGWVILNKKVWTPCMRKPAYGRSLKHPVIVEGKSYEAMAWAPDGRIYLMDGITYALYVDTRHCNRTAEDIVNQIMEEVIAEVSPEAPWKQALEKGEIDEETKSGLWGMHLAFLRQLALLKSMGLID